MIRCLQASTVAFRTFKVFSTLGSLEGNFKVVEEEDCFFLSSSSLNNAAQNSDHIKKHNPNKGIL
jgi:hypothetical protein